jgi:hypothetical protein
MSCAKNLATTTFNIHIQPLIEENLHKADASASHHLPDFDITFLHVIKLIDNVRVFSFVRLGLRSNIGCIVGSDIAKVPIKCC